MHVIVCYDIPDTKRRTMLRKTLLRFGNPVQYSVFECDLKKYQLNKMEKEIRKIISEKVDNVRFYVLCGKCIESVEFFGGKSIVKTKNAYIV